jgi:hypothetical protein
VKFSTLKPFALGIASSASVAVALYLISEGRVPGLRTAAAPVVAVYLLPGLPLAAAIAPLLPDGFVYWLFPDGGPAAFAALAAGCAVLFWAGLFTWGASRYFRRTRNRAAPSNQRLERP